LKTLNKEAKTLLHILSKLAEEFNCGAHQVNNIYKRDQEKAEIEDFFTKNCEKGTSGLIYVCGHPGTGKTSIINKIMRGLAKDDQYEIFNYNGMAFQNLFEFSKTFIADLIVRKSGEVPKRKYEAIKKNVEKKFDLTDAANKIKK